MALLLEDGFQVVEGLHPGPEGFREAPETVGNDHELLEVHLVVGVGAPVDDVHAGDGQGLGVHSPDVAVERLAAGLRGRLGHRQGDREDRVRPQLLLEGAAVQVDHELVDQGLVEGILPDDLARDRVVDRGHRLAHPLAQVALLVAVADLHRLALAGGGSGRDGRAPHGPALEHDLDLDGGVAAAVEDLTREDGIDGGHAQPCSCSLNAGSTRHSSPGVTTTTPPSVTVWRRRSSAAS